MADDIVLLDPSLHLFDLLSLNGSDVSVLSDPFSEEYEAIQPNYDFQGKEVFTELNFSDAFKQAIDSVKPFEGGIKSMMAEAPDQIRAKNVFTQIKKRVPLMAQIKILNLLNDKELSFGEEIEVNPVFVPDEKKTWEDIKDEVFRNRNILKNIKKMTEREKSRKIQQAQAENEAYETMSGYWRLLTGYNEFRITPPGYDAYAVPHWLETEPITWEVREQSRQKVLQWLSKYFSRY